MHVGAGTMLTCGKDNVLKVLDLRTFEERAALRAPGFAVGAVWSNACLGPDERHAAAGAVGSRVSGSCLLKLQFATWEQMGKLVRITMF